MRQYIDHVVYLNRIDSHYYLKEHTILYVFRAPRYNSPYTIKLVQILISKRAQISNYLTPPTKQYYDSDYPFISQYDLLEGQKLGITDLLLTLYTYLSLSTVYQKLQTRIQTSIEPPYSFTNRYRPINYFYKPLWRPLTLLQTTTDLLTTFIDYYKTSSTYYAPPYTIQYGRYQ